MKFRHFYRYSTLDVAARLDELRSLRGGWLDGEGRAPSQAGLDWFSGSFESNYPEDLPLPYLYPTAEGGVLAEWTLGQHEISLEVDFGSKQGEWHNLNMATDREEEQLLKLCEVSGWGWLVVRIRNLMAEDGE